MVTEVPAVECGVCGQSLDARPDEPAARRSPCPGCGSLRRSVKVYAHDEVTFLDDLSSLRHKRPGFKSGGRSRLVQEQSSVRQMSSDGVVRTVRRVVDRGRDWYEETVLNPDGSLHHQQAHRLSEHRGHGSDKPGSEGSG
jgi:hypothetical protein